MGMKDRHYEKTCPKCGKTFDKLTRHHVFPQALVSRLRGKRANEEKNHVYVLLCQECHDRLHDILNSKQKLTLNDCAMICWKFLMGDTLYF